MEPSRAMATFLRTWRTEWAGLTQAQLDSHRNNVLFDDASLIQTFLDPTRRNWWTDKYMILEVGHGDSGYDTGYGNVPMYMLGS